MSLVISNSLVWCRLRTWCTHLFSTLFSFFSFILNSFNQEFSGQRALGIQSKCSLLSWGTHCFGSCYFCYHADIVLVHVTLDVSVLYLRRYGHLIDNLLHFALWREPSKVLRTAAIDHGRYVSLCYRDFQWRGWGKPIFEFTTTTIAVLTTNNAMCFGLKNGFGRN